MVSLPSRQAAVGSAVAAIRPLWWGFNHRGFERGDQTHQEDEMRKSCPLQGSTWLAQACVREAQPLVRG